MMILRKHVVSILRSQAQGHRWRTADVSARVDFEIWTRESSCEVANLGARAS